MSIFELKYIDPDTGLPAALLPHHQGLSLSPVFSAVGAVQFSYPEQGKNFELLRPAIEEQDVEVAVFRDDVEIPDLRFIIEEYSGDEVNEAEENTLWTFTGRTLYSLLERAIVYPPGFGTATVQDTYKFTDATAGKILGTLVTEAKGRGAIPTFQIGSFSELVDSNDTPWTKIITIEYRAGLKLSEILENLIDQGMVEARMYGRELRMYVPDSLSQDRSTGLNPVVFRAGRDLRDAPRKVSRKEIASVFLAGGSEGKYVESVNATGLAQFGRWESFDSQGGVADIGTLTTWAEHQRDIRGEVLMEKSHGLVFGPNTPQPIRDFDLGDWVLSSTGGTPERLRVKQWVVTQGSDGELTGGVVLNDLFSELQEKLVKRVKGILGGTTLTGESRATDPEKLEDTTAPLAPSGLSGTSSAYVAESGETFAQVTLNWNAVTTNEDGSPATDLQAYLVRYRYQSGEVSESWSSEYLSEDTTMHLSPFLPNKYVDFIVRAFDRSSNRSEWSDTITVLTALDDTPPPVPSQPVAEGALGQIRITWDGLGSAGELMPADFKFVEVHISNVNNFTPDDTTKVGALPAGGTWVTGSVSDPVYNTDNYIKFVAVDTTGNKSAASAQDTAQAGQVVKTDLGGAIIDFDNVRFRDTGNLVPDGSFELDETADVINPISARFQVVPDPTGTAKSPNVLRMDAQPGPAETLWLNRYINGADDMKHLIIVDAYGVGIPSGEEVRIKLVAHHDDGSPDTDAGSVFIGVNASDDGWYYRFAFSSAALPTGASRYSIGITNSLTTPGAYVLFDRVEVRRKVGTLIIEDAAIDRAKIADLAVNNAKIEDLEVGKLTAGVLNAEVILAEYIMTSDWDSGLPKIVMGPDGVYGYNAADQYTFMLDAWDGSFWALGELQSGTLGGDRAIMSAVGPWGEPALWFINPTKNYGFNPTVYGPQDNGSLRMISAEQTANSSGRTQIWLHMDHWEIDAPFVPEGTSIPTSEVHAAGEIEVMSGNDTDIHLVAGAYSTAADLGRIQLRGKFDESAYSNDMFFGFQSGAFSLGGAGASHTGSVVWGTTMLGTPRMYATAQRGEAATANVSSPTTTACGYKVWSLETGGSALVRIWGYQT